MNKLYVINFYFHNVLIYTSNVWSFRELLEVRHKYAAEGWTFSLVKDDDAQMIFRAV